jgi:hypothetical protein
VCRFQISQGGVCMNIRVVHSDYDLFVHYFSSLGVGVLFKSRRCGREPIGTDCQPPPA